MKKTEIIKKSYEVNKIINTSKSYKNKIFSIYFIENNGYNRFLITVPKKIGNAVTRNKIKRRVKNIIDNNRKYIEKKYDYVIIIRKEIININYNQMKNNLLKLFLKIGEIDEKN